MISLEFIVISCVFVKVYIFLLFFLNPLIIKVPVYSTDATGVLQVRALNNPLKNAAFLFKAIKFATSDILSLPPVDKEGLFSPKQGRGQEALLLCILHFNRVSSKHQCTEL